MNNISAYSKILCACRNCPNEATKYLKIKFVHKIGQFCENCSVNLKRDGIVEEEINDVKRF
jgi:hypothetical protein